MIDSIVKFYYCRLFWVTLVWWRVTQFVSKLVFDSRPVEDILTPKTPILDMRLYRRDPMKGKLDVMTHPEVAYARVLEEGVLGDCEDYVALRAAVMLKYVHGYKYYLGCMFYHTPTGRKGHAVLVYKTPEGYRWVDYGPAKPISSRWGWADPKGDDLIASVLVPIKGLSKSGAIRFGKPYCGN